MVQRPLEGPSAKRLCLVACIGGQFHTICRPSCPSLQRTHHPPPYNSCPERARFRFQHPLQKARLLIARLARLPSRRHEGRVRLPLRRFPFRRLVSPRMFRTRPVHFRHAEPLRLFLPPCPTALQISARSAMRLTATMRRLGENPYPRVTVATHVSQSQSPPSSRPANVNSP